MPPEIEGLHYHYYCARICIASMDLEKLAGRELDAHRSVVHILWAADFRLLPYRQLSFKSFSLKLDQIRYHITLTHFLTYQPIQMFALFSWLDVMHQTQILPYVVKFQTKGLEIKLTVAYF